MNTPSKLERLEAALNRIRIEKRVRTQGELAAILGVSQSTLSAALNNGTRYLTESLVHRAEMLAGPPAPPVQIPAEQPPQDIVIPAATAKMYADMAESIRILSELVAAQQKGVEINTAPAANG